MPNGSLKRYFIVTQLDTIMRTEYRSQPGILAVWQGAGRIGSRFAGTPAPTPVGTPAIPGGLFVAEDGAPASLDVSAVPAPVARAARPRRKDARKTSSRGTPAMPFQPDPIAEGTRKVIEAPGGNDAPEAASKVLASMKPKLTGGYD